MVSFDVSVADRAVILEIVDRVAAITKADGHTLDKPSTLMDLVATHANGSPLFGSGRAACDAGEDRWLNS